ncbi:MAG: LacI family transcriptional regulator [Actinomycetales bacterium]|nr:LacI family transcriptional regulator [Actinomycetales bacterium]
METPRTTRVGIRDVARVAGVSPTTVSHAINRPERVSRRTRELIEQAIAETGYVPDASARLMRGMLSPLVGCVVLDIGNPFFGEVLRGVEDHLHASGCIAVTCSSDLDPARETRYLSLLQAQRPRGLILNPVTVDPGAVRRIVAQGSPVVLLDHDRADLPVCAVKVDHRAGGRLAADHLVGLGHRQLAIFTADPEILGVRERMEGFLDGVRDAGLDPARHVTRYAFQLPHLAPDAEAVVERMLARPPLPTGIFCLNDQSATELLRCLTRRDVAVPRDVSLVGYDDLADSEVLSPPLTTVRQPKYDLGRAAADLLLHEADQEHRHEQVGFRPELVVRASTAPPSR